MSIGLDAAQQANDALMDTWQHAMTIGNVTVRGIVQPLDPFDPDLPTGADPRECADITFRRAELPDGIVVGQVVIQDGGAAKWKLWKRTDNPADFNITFRALKVTEKDIA